MPDNNDPARLAAEEWFSPARSRIVGDGDDDLAKSRLSNYEHAVHNLADIIRKHYAETLDAKDAEIERLRAEVSRLEARGFEDHHKLQLFIEDISERDEKIKGLRKLKDAADRMREEYWRSYSTHKGEHGYDVCYECDHCNAAHAYDAARKEIGKC